MSAPSSQASVASTSDSRELGCAPSGRSSRTPTAEPSSPSTSPTPSDSRTCETSAPTTSPRSISSAEASPARISAAPAKEQESTASARVFGPSSLGSLASFDPDTSSWRTSQLSLETSGLDEFSETWPRAGMTRSGIAYLLRPLAPLTAGTASGSLPTPRATDGDKGGRGDLLAVVRTGKGSRRKEWPTPHGMSKPGQHRRPGPSGNELGRAVNEEERRSWPTPTATPSGPDFAQAQRLTTDGGDDLATAVARETFPTPIDGAGQGGRNLREAAPGGPLNPMWVEWLMGFPPEWTALPPSATPLSRRSRSGSADGSSTSSGSE